MMSFAAAALWLTASLAMAPDESESWRYRAEFRAESQLLRIEVCTPSDAVPLVLTIHA